MEINKGCLGSQIEEEENKSAAFSANGKSLISVKKEDQFKLAEAEMGEVKEENERLKMLLGRIAKDYKSLQMHFFDILHQQEAKSADTASDHQANEEPELVSLSLGITSTDAKKEEKKNRNSSHGGEDERLSGGLSLGLDCLFERGSKENRRASISNNSFDELKEVEPTEVWPPSKITSKTMRSGEDEVLQQIPSKKARVSVRARCDTPTMNDGCQWRKYGQKIAKGNPCPRGYYRCTVSPSCPVRKQVQRCVDDMSILITTYEGTHNHPLPVSATAMASTTSAAASMLQSHSASSQGGLATSATAPLYSSTATNLHGYHFTVPQNSRQQPFLFANSSVSTSNSHPTVTLDLTTAPSTSSSFGRFSSTPRYSSTGLSFSSSSSPSLEPNAPQPHWNGYGGYNGYGKPASNDNHIEYLNSGKQPFQDQPYQTYTNNHNPFQQPFQENIVAATNALTSNPKFQTVLAAALTSYVGDGGGGARENQVGGENSSLKLRRSDSRAANPIFHSQNGIGCGSSFLSKSSSLNSSQPVGLSLFPPSLQLASKGASAAPAHNSDHFKL